MSIDIKNKTKKNDSSLLLKFANTSINGKLVFNKSVGLIVLSNTQEIDVTGIANGIYFINLTVGKSTSVQ